MINCQCICTSIQICIRINQINCHIISSSYISNPTLSSDIPYSPLAHGKVYCAAFKNFTTKCRIIEHTSMSTIFYNSSITIIIYSSNQHTSIS